VNEFPHMSAIGHRENGQIIWFCGGSLISENFVLTAAHCGLFSSDALIIRVGDSNLKKSEDGANPQEFKVIAIVPHPDYSNDLKYHDLALMKLDRKAM
jgi:secreted trypsin-like serine protease